MATSTTNLGLTKPAGTDKIRIAQINGNMDILDEKIGAVGNTSLQAQVTSQNEAMSTYSLGNLDSLSALQTALVTLNGTISNNQFKNITFGMNNAGGLFASTVYSGTLIRFSSTRFRVELGMGQHAYGNIVGSYNNGTWEWDSLALNSKIQTEDILSSGNVTLSMGTMDSLSLGKKTLSIINFQMKVKQLTISDSQQLAQISLREILPIYNTYLNIFDDYAGIPVNGAVYINTNGTMTYYGEALSDKRVVVIGTYISKE